MSQPNQPSTIKLDYERSPGTTTEWVTPKALLEALGPFDLDPCVPPTGMPWPSATVMLSPAEDGLATHWDPSAFVWHNPPYGKGQARWMAKAAEHGNGITMVMVRTETKWFQQFVFGHPNAKAVLFLGRRLRFCDTQGKKGNTTTAGSVLVAYGDKAVEHLQAALKANAVKGTLLVLPRRLDERGVAVNDDVSAKVAA